MLPMCGRMVAIALKKMARAEGKGRTIRDLVKTYTDRYNIAPTQQAVTVFLLDGEWTAGERRWGLVPSWAKDEAIGSKLFNARAETIQEKPSFRSAFKRSRLLVPVSGFYEWGTIAGRKRPYFIHPSEGEHWWFAGLGETWPGPGGPVESFTVITTEANRAMAELHHRMPVILGPEDAEAWMDPSAPPEALQSLLRPCPNGWIEAHEVGSAVGNVRNDGPELILPVA